jgi:futalosine hydrolase
VILVVCATAGELRGFSGGPGIDVLYCGIGPVEAAIVTTRALQTARYDAVINAGIAGVFRGRGQVGDAFAVSREILAELGMESGEPLSLPPGLVLETSVDADAGLLAVARSAGLKIGVGVTVSTVTATVSRAELFAGEYRASIESMEGFSVLRAAAALGVPSLEVRGISNFVGLHSDREWDFDAGARATVQGLAAFFGAYRLNEA